MRQEFLLPGVRQTEGRFREELRIRPDIQRLVWVVERVRAVLRSMGVTVVDLFDAFIAHRRPLDLFPFGLWGHYSPEGHALVARVVAAEIDRLLAKPVR